MFKFKDPTKPYTLRLKGINKEKGMLKVWPNVKRQVFSSGYNTYFSMRDGYSIRYGKNYDDNPRFSPFGPEIADIEVSTVCNRKCDFCYKRNGSRPGENMTLKTFKKIFKRLPKTINQIALGIGSIEGNPELEDIINFIRFNDVIPNITINTELLTWKKSNILDKCGGVAVSLYEYEDTYRSVEQLLDEGHQVNIHVMVSEETLDKCYKALEDCRKDPRLKGLHALVFLAFKDKRGTDKYTPLTFNHWKQLMDTAMVYQELYDITIGFDTCTAPMFVKAMEKHPHIRKIMESVEGCESYRFSIYINVHGIAYPCSFMENLYDGENILKTKFSKIWDGFEARSHRSALAASTLFNDVERCPVYKVWRKTDEDNERIYKQ